MPWSNQSGGGGWKGGGGGPWGQPPRGGGGGGGNTPDLEELLRRSQDRLKRVLPGGGGGAGGVARIVVPVVLLLIVGIWAYKSIYVVQPDEVGVELLFGNAEDELAGPGIHFRFWPFEQVERVPVLRENQENIGFASGRSGQSDGAIMLSGDQNLVDVEFTVLWRIDNPQAYLFNVASQQNLVRLVSESAMREYVGRTPADQFRTTGREAAQTAVRDLIQETLDYYQAGIVVTALNLERADPPSAVIDAFEEVQRAQQDQERFRQEAQAYANSQLGMARGQAAQIREQAEGYRQQTIAEAQGQAQRFQSVLAEYLQAEDVTRTRIYLETMEAIYQSAAKILVDEETTGTGVVPYLPLDGLQRSTEVTN